MLCRINFFSYSECIQTIIIRGNCYFDGIGMSLLKEIYNLTNSKRLEMVVDKIKNLKVNKNMNIKSVNYTIGDDKRLYHLDMDNFINLVNTGETKDHILEYISTLPFLPFQDDFEYDNEGYDYLYEIDFTDRHISMEDNTINGNELSDQIIEHFNNFNLWGEICDLGYNKRWNVSYFDGLKN